MKIFLPLVTWTVLILSSTVHSQQQQTQYFTQTQLSPFKTNLKNSRFRNEVFFINLEDGYFGCQVNASSDYLQLYELSKLCDGSQDCYMGSDELSKELKCTNDCDKDGTQCINGVCLNGVCHCNDGWGGCNCNDQDENECKSRPCDVFAHCTNTLGSYTCTCFPGYRGDGHRCEDIDECQDPQIAARCVENAECCNLPAHFLCKCKDGYEGDGEVLCTDIDECQNPNACGHNAQCINMPGNYTCTCPDGFYGNPYDGCLDIDECAQPNVCGPNAICTNLEGSYRCDCPTGYDGDGRSEAGCLDYDECARSPCGRNAQCQNTEGSFKCLCPDGYSGDPMHGCEAACVLDTECTGNELCQGGQCVNPCSQPQACGMNALCSIDNHYKQCSCPAGFTGNAEVECVRIPIACSTDLECGQGYNCRDGMCFPECGNDQDCALNEKCLRGICMLTCRVDNDCFLGHVCLHNKCVFGCHTDDDCSASESCRNDKCIHPCSENPCGPNAACSVSNHRATCTCLDGMVPSPTAQVGCVRAPPQECSENRDCSNGLACFEAVCRPLCADDLGCLSNERCQNGVCKPLCRRDDDCRNSEVCLGLSCVAGCRSDQGCPDNLSCINQQCVDPCADARACGTNSQCNVFNHQKVCSCPDGLVGNPEVSCKPPITVCQTNADCQSNQLCYGGSCQSRCRNDQNCLADEKCMRGSCRTVCNTDSACAQGQICENRICQIGCRNDLTCAQDQACVNKQCKNPCDTPGQCGQCANCLVVNHGVQCSCPNGFLGDGLTGCQMPPQRCNPSCQCDESNTYCAESCTRNTDCACGQMCMRGKCRSKCGANRSCPVGQLCERGACVAGCKTNNDCATDQTCIKGQCSDPCANKKSCGRNALCTVSEHRMLCYCPDGYEGEPNKECIQFECQHDEDCEANKRCDKGKCRNPCLEFGACGVNAQCRVVDRRPQCSCPPDFFGDAATECQPLEGGCDNNPCGENARCNEVPGGYECSCMEGCVGDAKKGCICDGNIVDVCHHQVCGLNAACRVLPHDEAQCYCPEEYPNGDPYVQCYLTQPPRNCLTEGCAVGECVREGYDYVCKQEIGCASNSDCPAQKACINSICVDPCSLANHCGPQQECKVIEHQPVCSRLCECQRKSDCPKDFECDGCQCRQVIQRTPGCEHCAPGYLCDASTGACIKVECSHDADCSITEACINQRCLHPCDAHNPCAQNAVCVNTNHAAECSCTDGYEGNGYVGCQPAFKSPPVCQYNEDCPPNKLCDRLNRRCINPCQEDSCGENAECLAVNHGIECRCLPGYAGNAYVECSVLQGCRSDGECAASEACINGKCSSPCSCGAYALCDVVNHRGICKCPPGYTGNPAIACSPPSNPCDPNPCGTNALCELDNGNPICYCPKGRTGNPFKNCIPEGDECTPNPCGPNSGCRMVSNSPICFCLPEYEGQPPHVPCQLPSNPCDPSPCGPNTQCTTLSNGFSKCTCLPGYVESPNTIRGCIEPINPCDPNPCGIGAICDSTRNPVCFCPDNKIGNPFRLCEKPSVTIELCKPGPCGQNADCYVTDNREECYCRPGYIGDPYQSCREPPRSVCEPNPCGPNAECVISPNGQSACVCPDGLAGDPNSSLGCHGYECQVDDDCPFDKACMGFKCHDPCPGACGHGANCRVEQHHPVCSCNPGLTGNPGVFCYALDVPKKNRNPCVPSPCGLNSECKVMNNRAVCSCLPSYLGDPKTGCRPECDINSDCGSNQACINHKCIDPCAGTICGINALCSVQQHTPVCRCLDGFTGDAFRQCIAIGVLHNVSRDPCVPSPCGPSDVCSVYTDGVALCDPCFGPDAQYNPRCRPECISNSDCPFDKACLGSRCLDPCPGSCGHKALCHVYEHNPICSCPPGLYGNPYDHCDVPIRDKPTPSPSCAKLQCGANAECKKQSGVLSCVCRKGYFGNPFVGCRPECVLNSDCPVDRACVNSKCVDVCSGVCGINALCQVVNHGPVCICPEGYTGDAFKQCSRTPQIPNTYLPVDKPRNPCEPSPCGPNARCLISPEGYAACSCLPDFKGSPPVCQPECIVSSECPLQQACINQRCADPCPGTCGVSAKCKVQNHNPICSCEQGYEGDPFVSCQPVQESPKEVDHPRPQNPCVPSPCGPNSICQVKQGRPVCSCVANYVGSPPYCRPECTLNSECPADKACIQEKCENPCVNTCGHNAKCTVIAHSAYCSCEEGYEGDAFVGCSKVIKPQDHVDPCYANPCAENAVCTERNGIARCSCIEPYIGDPYSTGCRPECVYNAECPSQQACIKQHCRDPCVGTCGSNAECSVVNHVPVCSCARGYVGDPFTGCKKDTQMKPISPCEPNVCGPYSICRAVDGRPTCSCQEGYFGAPPNCRPECVVSSECSQHLACINQKCVDPCVGTCGFNAKCQVVNHNPICSCPSEMTGDPFEQCVPKPKQPTPEINACLPSPCGPNAQCRDMDNRAVCSCLPGMFGAPPNCRPECVIHQDCPSNRACIAQRCEDPCAGACGFNAVCTALNHKPVCSCLEGHEGDPYAGCSMRAIVVPDTPSDPCNPSPCGSNAICRERNGAGACSCLPNYFGDPYINCRPECVQNSDCPRTKTCLNMKCVDPCENLCGYRAVCRVANHQPMCSCEPGFTGNPMRICVERPSNEYLPLPRDPCRPSPCGQFSTCRVRGDRPICSCLPNYMGQPPNCKPECVISAECPSNKACMNQRCVDPCPGTCGHNARCRVTNHSPICTCVQGYTGDPFHQCQPERKPETPRDPIVPLNPCVPSPCGANSQCRVSSNGAVCSCLRDYVGRPPNCRPECSINSECPSQRACVNNRCVDPCIGSCGNNALCHVSNHVPVCMCQDGFTGDPFSGCYLLIQIPDEPAQPCNPSPCGLNALCEERNRAAACKCIPEYFGDPYVECRPECVLNSDCSKSQACVNNKCVDPCPGVCGHNAECYALNHQANCECLLGFTGNPNVGCHPIPETPKYDITVPSNPCVPSPCGLYSNCRVQNGHAVCSCLANYIGAPPNCRPECMTSSDCAQDKSCINEKCKDPCPGTCGINAQCRVVNHNPICSCMSGYTGDPFIRCIYEEKRPVARDPVNPCVPSPCGPNSQCRVSPNNEQAVCSCLPNYIGRAPNCRPECTSNSECRGNMACINQRCQDPCQGSCGSFTTCIVNNHRPICRCLPGYTGDPFSECSPQIVVPTEKAEPCNPSPCGANAVCKERNGVGSCTCLPEYHGDPYTECRPECVLNTDCSKNRACINNKCRDPCPGVCGVDAQCHVINHAPSCSCPSGYTGNPSEYCRKEIKQLDTVKPCRPSPCGPYSQCREVNGHAVCSCLTNYMGTPPACRPECSVSSECAQDRACLNLRCVDPCPGTCGNEAVCKVTNHNPICSCPLGYTGDPFIRCIKIEERKVDDDKPTNPCIPSPCGPNSQCRVVGETPVCSCLPDFVGRAPNCRPECSINSECPANLACINEKCKDPCPGSCGFNAFCNVVNHSPVCSCEQGYSGDPFAGCNPTPLPEERLTPCNPSPCGPNAECKERNGAGSCTCVEGYFGDPYSGCRPECVVNSDCPRDKSCVNQKCTDPCPGVCGMNAECRVGNHVPTCHCLPGFTGNPLSSCRLIPEPEPTPIGRDENPCQPSPCGPYSQCREVNGHAVCSCQTSYIGSPPNCRPECIVSSDCAQNMACQNQKCIDPCPGTCGPEARCQVVNHYAACSCPPGYTGDPFNRCTRIKLDVRPVEKTGNPCVPSPCGPNSKCIDVGGGSPACSCLPDYLGRPPNCRPECMSSSDCPANMACMNQKCSNPCAGACGIHTQCTVIKHSPACQCEPGYTGDPFSGCSAVQITDTTERPRDPCNPSPCGANAICRERNGVGSCACLPEYFGDPYTGCRPECVQNSDCDRSKACFNNKCQDPCPGVCGINAECRVINHAPNCQCFEGYTGDAHRACSVIEVTTMAPLNPCYPSPCGPYSQCRESNGHAVCSCLDNYIGAPPSCRPECVVSSECPQNRACIQQKCGDPCAGACGSQARCQVVNHNPICTCPADMTGDPFVECVEDIPTVRDPQNPCVPSPCGPNSLCREIGGQAACSCQTNYIGRPPNCRPECTNHDECQSNLACQNERCIDPCPGSCGSNALCKVVQHNAICSCADGYEGDPISGCQLIPPVLPKQPPTSPCEPSPCGPHAECRERNGAGACYCHEGYEGNPYDAQVGCRRECESNDECSPAQACVRFKCVDPCINICGEYAICSVDNHVPTCTCPQGYSGDPFFQCKPVPITPRPIVNPCVPSPCGPNSICRNINDQAVCSCQSGFVNQPPNCRPECVVSSECSADRACVNNKCVDPCQHTCGQMAICQVKNHSPICTCPRGMTGDPFVKCSKIPIVIESEPTEKPPSCVPSPCGPNSKCQIIGGSPACSCLPDFTGAPPNCRPECVLNSECGPSEACINQKCRDPCPGSCGFEAKCHVLNHVPICNCLDGYTGDPFVRCSPEPVTEAPKTPNDPCDPNPCGPNADCFNGECRCQDNYQGNPYDGCRPECTLSADCPRDKACMRNKCVDPCPGTCGINALCEVLNHIPVCSCQRGYEGDPFTNCRLKQDEPERPAEPCSPSPCGPNSQCRNVNDHAVCSCMDGFIGAPPQCRPECVVSSECSALQACVNKKCVDPCAGACGIDARCEVINHSPICGCPPGKTGDPFKRCLDIPPPPPTPKDPVVERDPCDPSPCGPNSVCKSGPNGPSCQCLPEFFGSAPNCRPECIINPDCPSTQACINNKCRDPCPGSCGTNAECRVISHTVSCSCPSGFAGNAFVQCIQQREEPIRPCEPSPCGPNAECIERNGAASCKCVDDYQGNPYEGCRPECVLSSDCPTDMACIRNKCKDPCPGICGSNAQCYAVNHVPNCVCNEGYTGDPFSNCRPEPKLPPPAPGNPCQPSPCGPNSKCRVSNGLPVCSCLDNFVGAPPNCKPECTVNAECPQNKACHKFKCANPCAGTCGIDAKCEVINHNPICSCALDMTGDPFTRCYPAPELPKDVPTKPKNPCIPSPCGLYSECRVSGDQPSCSCLPNYVGAPPNCRPECVVNTDCPSDLACIAEKCRNPCDGTCGINSECRIQNHLAICTCRNGFTGDPFSQCIEIIEEKTQTPVESDPCSLQPCGANAECRPGGVCVCLRDYQGDPYVGCRPECTLSTDCSPNKACLNKKCVDPCPGTCGQNAQCDVNNHIPVCSCPKGFTGDPFINCRQVVRHEEPVDFCRPNPCGPNSVCQVSAQGPKCACQQGMLGSPPACKPECIVSSECSLQTACINRKCVDPCPGACGQFAKCQVINHNPICTCNNGYTGDPFTRCYEEPKVIAPPQPQNPCVPSPCGPNSECKVVGDSPACSCAATFLGTPPNCRPECTINPECPSTKACIRQKCEDPCVGSCGFNARCTVANHMPICSCEAGFTGDPFSSCQPIPVLPPQREEPKNPCRPSPCGSNAECRIRGDGFTCECVRDYIGNPYEGCRPECVGNSECPANRACIRQKCADPCPGTCGVEAVCTINNHIPICSCPNGYTGNAFVQCSPIVVQEIPVEKQTDPCYPTPCGQNTICRTQGKQAVCECLPGFFGNPYGPECRPECTLSSDCAKNKACVNNKCVDPCPGVCGYGAVCQTVNHNPICSCPSSMVGNPFVECHEAPKQLDPCNPSPCRTNGVCRVRNNVATCSYPECVVNEDCSRDRTCVNQKCRDPCINACGLNAICTSVNHKAVCTCPPGFYGSPYNSCMQQMDVVPVPKPECVSDNDCSNDKACVNQQCKNPCELDNICGLNARCHVQRHRPLCVCNEGYTGNALNNCYLIGCRSDEECPATEACINKQCTDPCLYTQCGSQAICRSDYNHKARCHCPNGYRGNPLVRCERPECTRDDDCAFNLACRNERCEDPCNCGLNAQCRVNNHQAQCRCPPGYVGNPAVRCDIEEAKVAPQCTMDSDCSSKLACFSGECKNPCIVTQPCGANAKCSVVDTLPLRTMICECEPGYVGDADVGCRKEPVRDQGCQSNEECPSTEACRNGNCVNPCIDSSPCARSAECLAQQHRAICTCPQGTQGDPFVNCYQPPQITAGCTHDSECPPTAACINKRCQDPCAEGNPCAGNAECRVLNNRPICSCPSGWGGDPQIQCFKPECKINADCPYDKSCINENCVNPCTYGNVRCGTNAQCEPQNHQAVCVCPAGTQGNPFVSCITGHCQYNEDCADHEACDRLNRVCRPVCDEDTCAVNAICLARQHQPMCQCPAGYTGDPYQQCLMPKQPPATKPKPECTQDADCPSQLACINQRCANPCAAPHVCTPRQTCTVLDTLPLRTMICKCPSDTITDNSGNCVPIKHDVIVGCQHNDECANTEVCQRGNCINACRLERCGVNAQCLARDHYAQCTCPKGYEGNPRVECRGVVYEQPKTPAECTTNDDCPHDKTCRNERCVNPCVEEPCGQGAYCHVQNRQAICRCPPGYSGEPKQGCVPPRDVITVGCKSNSDCQLTESCVNEQCVNPCNCGPNTECQVRNHHPICYCKPGFSGNAQYGCVQIGCQSDDECSADQQCVNRECVNPCLISDPCALNAECFGRNHRATCRCPAGMQGDPFVRCIRVECNSDYDCASNQACVQNLCINPCRDQSNPCAQNAICQALQHRAVCRCPDNMPLGNPYAYCESRPQEPVCRDDGDCPSGLACIDVKCQNPCTELSPCAASAQCSVLDSVPVRTMVCECPASYVPDSRGECKQLVLQTPSGCSSDSDCSDQEACINRQCRNPCNCGTNALCQVSNHRAICSCQDGFEGNPYTLCRSIGCRVDSECDSGKACVNGNCINPCLVKDPCGINAECYVQSNQAMCRCKSGFRGNAYERCRVIGCQSNNDCPSDKYCYNEQCVNPCVYQNTCSPRAECRAQNHLAICRCPAGFIGNPYVDCTLEEQPACRLDTDCPSRLACIGNECVDPCLVLEPCNRPAQCEVTPTSPVRTMICVCPDGYISSGSGTCQPTKTIIEVGGCVADSDCPSDRSCVNGVCRDPCNCGLNAECRIKDHKPVCTCRQGYEGNPEFECSKVECSINSDCPSTHACRNNLCVPACQGEQCGLNAQCLAVEHRAVCQCIPGFRGNARISCTPLGCRSDSECPADKACVNGKCENPCETTAACAIDEVCKVYQHRPQCACPPGTVARRNGCEPLRDIPICQYDGDCPSQTACIRGECINPCNATQPCGVNAKCKVLDTVPVRTMICECLEGYTGNAAVQCDKRSLCVIEKGFVRDIDGQCVCPPGTALDVYEYCTPCITEQGFKIDETGHCVCALERGFVIDERGRCICPTDHGYRLTSSGECIPEVQPECNIDEDCADNRYCHTETKTCEDPCLLKTCGVNAFCNAVNHRAQCQCIAGYSGNPDLICNHTNFRTDFPRPDMVVSCLADGVQVEIHITEPGFNGVLYVKGHSKDEECRRVVNLAGETVPRTEIFRVHFGSCGMQAVKDVASFVLVIQKHPKLVTYKAQAYNIKCVYQTGEKNVTLGFNVSMLTTAGTIANTGPPPICQMRIITHEGEEINSAEIGDNLKLQVDVEPATIYGGFARSCIAKTMEDNVENEYIVTDENGCATDPSIFGDWEYNPDTNSLLANFNAFKFPSSDNIRFQCNIRVCFGKCQPVNCRGYNAFGRRRRRSIADNSTDDSTAIATNTGMEGQLREEITISSNAILTFEKRTTTGANDANIKPAAQRVEDICVSMVGLIIALVITALLALVAVAVAVSCWLMAYRRRPKQLAPLPHPPEFPNPLFANPEVVPEPTPDYLS